MKLYHIPTFATDKKQHIRHMESISDNITQVKKLRNCTNTPHVY